MYDMGLHWGTVKGELLSNQSYLLHWVSWCSVDPLRLNGIRTCKSCVEIIDGFPDKLERRVVTGVSGV